MVNDCTCERALVFSTLHTSHGGQYTCRATFDQAPAMASTDISVQSVYVKSMSSCVHSSYLCFSLQFLHQQSLSHQTTPVFSMLALP